jgi:demethylmacrocin O-methyltransferase
MTFNDLCIKYGTDKGTSVRERHGYSFFYDDAFKDLKEKKLKILEIGIADPDFPGASLKVLTEYFNNATVYGLDKEACSFDFDRTVIFQGDTSKEEDIQKVIDFNNEPFDIVIDDGSHVHEHHLLCFNKLFPKLNKNGIYAIEDLQAEGGYKTVNYFFNEQNTKKLSEFGVVKAELCCYNKLLFIYKK